MRGTGFAGTGLVLLSAAGFGAMAIFAKLAYGEGVGVAALLMLRVGLAGVVLLGVAWRLGALRGLGRRAVLTGLAMGAVGYSAQAGLYFGALTRIDAGAVALAFCTYPLLVMALAGLTGRERVSLQGAVAALVAVGGLVLVLGGATAGSFEPVGAALALGSALVYAVYILVGDRVTGGISPLALTTLVCCGGFGTMSGATLATGGVPAGISAAGLGWVALLVLVSTVGAILLFFAGLAIVGPSTAALLGLVEPVVTVGLAAVVFREALTPQQALGALVVLGAVAFAQRPARPAAGPASAEEPASATT